jgi:glycosyltransferase involved in cell wall biosynthesis
MRIGMLTGSFLPAIGGMEYVIHYLSEALVNKGFDVVVFSHVSGGKPDPNSPYTVVQYGRNFPFSGRIGINRRSGIEKIKNFHDRNKIDLIHCHNVSYPGEIAIDVKKKIGIPIVMTPHGQDVQKISDINYGMRLKNGWEKKIRNHLEVADAITTISESIEKDIDFVLGSKIYRIPNGVQLSKFKGSPSNYLHSYLDIPLDTKIIISVGRNHIKKGYEAGIRAFAASGIHKEGNIRYAIVGKNVRQLSNVVNELKMESKIFLIPPLPQEDIIKCYHSSYLFFSPSITEGLSIVSIEAMAAGLPILATDVPGNRDIVKENHCGELVPCEDIQAMGLMLKKFIETPELRDQLASQSEQNAGRYDWTNIAEMYCHVYKTILHKKMA